jgi:putative Holliday junction resolvase
MMGSTELYISHMRVLGIDVGGRRVGLAISDRSRTLARPLETITVSTDAEAVDRVEERIARLAAEDDGLAAIVVGLPRSLDGSATAETQRVTAFVEALRHRTVLPIATEDERLSSREAESRLAVRERDWRARKKKLDAAAAAIILQDYLDRPE